MIWTALLTFTLAGQFYDIKVPTMGETACQTFLVEVYETAPRVLEIHDAVCVEEVE